MVDIRKHLNENQKNYAKAGNAEGRRWTPFQNTNQQVINYIKKNEGCSLKQLIESINHHYHSNTNARSCIAKWIKEGVIKGIKSKRDGRILRIYTSDYLNLK